MQEELVRQAQQGDAERSMPWLSWWAIDAWRSRCGSSAIETLDQLLTAEEGPCAVAVDAAYALRDETRRGHLAPATLADVTILSGDVTAATPDEIRDMEVIASDRQWHRRLLLRRRRVWRGLRRTYADPRACARDQPPQSVVLSR